MIKRGNILSRTLHKWLGLIVGIQLLIWLASGLYMVIVDIDFIHGDPLVKNMQQAVPVPAAPLVTASALIDKYPEAKQISLRAMMGEARYLVTTTDKRYLVNPDSGAVVSPLSEHEIRKIAKFHFNGPASISHIELITADPPMEIQTRRLPLWRVNFDDRFSTSFYIDPISGRLVTRRHQYWRIFDFMWMLHIMDYDERTDAHSTLLNIAQVAGLVFAITGLWLLFYSFSGRRKQICGGGMMIFLKQLHKWVGLLIGIQVTLWLLSGLVISLLDPVKVSGAEWAATTHSKNMVLEKPLEISALPPALTSGALSIDLKTSRDGMVYEIVRTEGVSRVNAINGLPMKILERGARTLASRDFTGDGEIISIERGMAPNLETRDHQGPYWRVDFSDAAESSIYISEQTGEVLERRNSHWRTRDFFWMLHIMDYSGREDFNNSLIITVALVAIWLGLSGFMLLFYSFNRHDFWFLNVTGKLDQATVTLVDPASPGPRKVKLRKGGNLFLTLAMHDIDLPSLCGGGGECGKCKVRYENADAPRPNMIEQSLIPRRQRERGFRLACQQEVQTNITLHLPEGSLAPQGVSATKPA